MPLRRPVPPALAHLAPNPLRRGTGVHCAIADDWLGPRAPAKTSRRYRVESGECAMELRADVVVIGGGIVGCATAYYLAKRGGIVGVG